MSHHEAFPASKLVGLLIRQISSPVAARIKKYAQTHPFFKKHVCIATAQIYNKGEIMLKMWILRLGRPVAMPVLTESEAVNLGGNILGEGLVFLILSAVLLAELNRQGNNEEAKKVKQQEEWDEKVEQLNRLKDELSQRSERIQQIRNMIQMYLDSKASKS